MTDMWATTPVDGEPDAGARFARPRDLEAERVVAASLMDQPSLIDSLAATFDPVDFSDPRYASVWYAVEELRNEIPQDRIPPHAVATRLAKWKAEGRITEVPLDIADLQTLYNEAMPASAAWYAERVAEKAVASRLVDLGITCQSAGMSAAFDQVADLASVQTALDRVMRDQNNGRTHRVGDIIDDALERAVTPQDTTDRVPTGFVDVDSLTGGGLRPGRLVVVAARPGVGKTVFGVGLARAAAIRNNLPVLFNTLEMGEDEISDMLLAAEGSVPHHHITSGSCEGAEVEKLSKAHGKIKPAPLFIRDYSGLSIPELRNEIRSLVRTEGLRMVVVDYLQLMQAPKAENRQVAVAAMSRQLKLIAREFGIVVVVLAQLNRASLMRTDKTPMISDLRESGAVEQDADMVILLHRPDMYEPESPRAGEADLIVDKHRGGHRAKITAAAQMHYSRFVDMAWTPDNERELVA